MTDDQKKIIYDAVKDALNDAGATIPPERHRTHHEFIEVFKKKEERKQQMWESAKSQATGMGMWGFISGLLALLLYLAKHFTSHNGGI